MTPESLASVGLVDTNLWNPGIWDEGLGDWRIHTEYPGKGRIGSCLQLRRRRKGFEN